MGSAGELQTRLSEESYEVGGLPGEEGVDHWVSEGWLAAGEVEQDCVISSVLVRTRFRQYQM
jgi:hypothetical protein